jgi:YD repeat-containing protein
MISGLTQILNSKTQIDMNINSDDKKNSVTFKKKKLQILFWVAIILGCTQNTYAKDLTNYAYTKALVGELLTNDFVTLPDLMELPGFSMQENDIGVNSKKVNGGLILDSIIEEDHLGIYTEYKRWQFFYNESKTLTQSICRYYNGNLEFQNITETRTYDEFGNEIKLVCHQTDNLNPYRWDYDTTAVDLYTEENRYENGKIVQKDIVNLAQRDFNNPTRQVKYDYNEKGQLISIFETTATVGLYDGIQYFYNGDDKIEFKVHSYSYNEPFPNYIEKNQYQHTDSMDIITKWSGYVNGQLQKSDLDTISTWYYIYTFNERYDSVNRNLSVASHYFAHYEKKDQPYYKAEYEFTEDWKLSQVLFSQWTGNADSGYYKETSRVENIYDEFGNLQQHLETFYDDRFSDWSIKEKKTYYYSSSIKSTITDKTKDLKGRIYPNPAENFIMFSNLPENNSGYQLYDMRGRLVGNGTVEHNLIDITELKAGIYVVKIHDFRGRFVKY